ncbi:hypothetical protein CEXT_248551 [Caerostris extrusa]|uniref:Uncharacterized protein n=1 Tax=Caerostris extrusa TaxID=172846 RepID=A0AAV4SJ24_CAEEX|nr:hypothetical protein CEXT_248551 [Caerostris extrusa]
MTPVFWLLVLGFALRWSAFWGCHLSGTTNRLKNPSDALAELIKTLKTESLLRDVRRGVQEKPVNGERELGEASLKIHEMPVCIYFLNGLKNLMTPVSDHARQLRM